MIEENLWGPPEVSNLATIPHVKNQVATEQDVQEGRAVFFIEGNEQRHLPINMKIPTIAYQIDPESNSKLLVVIIQAETVGNEKLVGVRYIEGGNGVCSLSEIEFNSNI